jgi:cyanophycin synthetase
MNPSASAAVLESSELSTLEQGLAFDLCQIAVITSTEGAEALARPGVEDRSHVDRAIRAPLDVVVPDGFAVLNAADPLAPEMAPKCKGKIVWFGGARDASPVKEHVDAGGSALVRLGSQLVWWSGGEKSPPLAVSQPTESTALSSVEPLMAAAAAVLALGVSRSAVQAFLSNFQY